MTAPPPCVWIWWSPGEPEDDLHGFVEKAERDACDCGKPGPFRRVVRDHHKLGPISAERMAMLDMFRKWTERAIQT
jgi:hypothetical protein